MRITIFCRQSRKASYLHEVKEENMQKSGGRTFLGRIKTVSANSLLQTELCLPPPNSCVEAINLPRDCIWR